MYKIKTEGGKVNYVGLYIFLDRVWKSGRTVRVSLVWIRVIILWHKSDKLMRRRAITF